MDNRSSNPESIQVPCVEFMGEQNGLLESELKHRLTDLLRNKGGACTAYLARVLYDGSSTQSVALCLRTASGSSTDLVEQIGRIFESMFSEGAHLDVIFVDEVQNRELIRCCRPFFSVPGAIRADTDPFHSK